MGRAPKANQRTVDLAQISKRLCVRLSRAGVKSAVDAGEREVLLGEHGFNHTCPINLDGLNDPRNKWSPENAADCVISISAKVTFGRLKMPSGFTGRGRCYQDEDVAFRVLSVWDPLERKTVNRADIIFKREDV